MFPQSILPFPRWEMAAVGWFSDNNHALITNSYSDHKGSSLDIEHFSQQAQSFLRTERAAQISAGVLGVFLLYLIIQLVMAFWPVSLPSEDNSVLQAKVQPLPNIPNWHLFGNYAVTEAKLLPQTRLNLTLEGIFYSTDAVQSQALIASPGVPVKVYRAGANLPGGAKIKEILPDSVIIEQNNKLAKLPLKKPELEFAPRPKGLESLKE